MESYRHTVHYYETDKMGITHHSNYIRWMEEARIDFLNQIGWGYDRLEEMGIISPVTAVDCKYKIPTTFPDEILIDVIVEEFNGIKLRLRYKMRNQQGKTVCKGHSEHCFLNRDKEVLRMNRVFPEFYNCLSALIPEE